MQALSEPILDSSLCQPVRLMAVAPKAGVVTLCIFLSLSRTTEKADVLFGDAVRRWVLHALGFLGSALVVLEVRRAEGLRNAGSLASLCVHERELGGLWSALIREWLSGLRRHGNGDVQTCISSSREDVGFLVSDMASASCFPTLLLSAQCKPPLPLSALVLYSRTRCSSRRTLDGAIRT